MKNFHMDLVRVTEAGAICAAEWVGRGNKEEADKAASEAMRDRLNKMDLVAEIAIGEGIKDESFGLYQGEKVGSKFIYRQPRTSAQLHGESEVPAPDPEYSIAIDPIEGTTPTAKGGYEAMSVIAMAKHGMLYQTPHFYMNKLAVGPGIEGAHIDATPEDNIAAVAKSLNKSVQHVTVCVLDRPRTKPLVDALRKVGCRIKFIADCDVTACIATCVPDSGIDMYWSIGGSPEAVIAAAAMKCMGGKLQCVEITDPINMLADNVPTLEIGDLVKGDCMFAATGITDGQLLKGVRFTQQGPVTHSIAMRSESGTIRRLVTEHGN